MSVDVGTTSIVVSGTTAVVTTAGGMTGWINDNALVIGISLSVASLIVGIMFKVLNSKRSERHHIERLALEKLEHEQTRQALLDEVRRMSGR